MDFTSTLAIIGGIALLVGIFGGGLEAKEVKIPSIPKQTRIISSISGVLIIGIAIFISVNEETNTIPPTLSANESIESEFSTDLQNTENKGLILSNETVFTPTVTLKDNRYIFRVMADRPLPTPEQLIGGGRIDFIWFIDADENSSTGQSNRGNDYNIHLYVTNDGWNTSIYSVSDVALENLVNERYSEVSHNAQDYSAEISFPISFFPNEKFLWSLYASSLNASEEWKDFLRYSFETSKYEFVP